MNQEPSLQLGQQTISFGGISQPSGALSANKPMMMNFGDYDQTSLIDLMKQPKFDVLKVYNQSE